MGRNRVHAARSRDSRGIDVYKRQLYTQADQGYVAWAGETGYTFGQLLHSPLLVLKMCYNTLAWQGEQLYSGMIGGDVYKRQDVRRRVKAGFERRSGA